MAETVSIERYEAALREHLRVAAEEQALLNAYELGRALMETGAGLLDVVRLHSTAMSNIEAAAGTDPQARRRADMFLAEVLSSFEMAYLGFKEANASLRHLTASLEQQVTERTRELQRSLSDLQAAEADRRRLLARVVSAEEHERQRIAADLHDDTIQAMTMAGLRISTLRRRLEEPDHPILDRIERSISQAVGRLRRLVFELRPPVLDHEGLTAALQAYMRTAMDDGPECRLDVRLDAEPPIATCEVAYRIGQEALANVRKHANANQVTVTLEREDDGLSMTVRDDGAGFDTRELDIPRPGHLGATTMRERAALADGWCTIHSAPGHGTTVALWLPYPTRSGS